MAGDESAPFDVVVVHWPAEDELRRDLRQRNVPRLLLVDIGSPAPDVIDPLEDWARLPAADADLQARMTTLAARASTAPEEWPSLDGDGVLRAGEVWVALSPVETRLVAAFLDRRGAVVGRHTLTRAGWLDEPPSRNALDVKILRLRRRLQPLGLTIRTVRARGYLLETRQPALPQDADS